MRLDCSESAQKQRISLCKSDQQQLSSPSLISPMVSWTWSIMFITILKKCEKQARVDSGSSAASIDHKAEKLLPRKFHQKWKQRNWKCCWFTRTGKAGIQLESTIFFSVDESLTRPGLTSQQNLWHLGLTSARGPIISASSVPAHMIVKRWVEVYKNRIATSWSVELYCQVYRSRL